MGPLLILWFFSLAAECIIVIDILRTWQHSHIGSQICGVKSIIFGKAKWKLFSRPQSRKVVNQKQYTFLEGL